MRRLMKKIFYPLAYAISKEQKDEDLRVKYAHKACHKLFSTTYFLFAAFWGWSILKDSEYLPWYLGGPANGSLSY